MFGHINVVQYGVIYSIVRVVYLGRARVGGCGDIHCGHEILKQINVGRLTGGDNETTLADRCPRCNTHTHTLRVHPIIHTLEAMHLDYK